jgi:hypothetical protein
MSSISAAIAKNNWVPSRSYYGKQRRDKITLQRKLIAKDIREAEKRAEQETLLPVREATME